MNEYLLLTLLERLLLLYNNREISLDKQCPLTQEFKYLIGEVQDTLSHVE